MFSYLAFKGLDISLDGNVSSPQQKALWRETETPWGTFLYLAAREGDLARGRGVFAANYNEAASYSTKVFLCAPDPRYNVVVGESGWRADAAMALCQVRNKEEGADIIIRAYLSGYPQIPEILAWALGHTRNITFSKMLVEDDILLKCNLNKLLDWASLNAHAFVEVLEKLYRVRYHDDIPALRRVIMQYRYDLVRGFDLARVEKFLSLLVDAPDAEMRVMAAEIIGAGRFYGLWRRLVDDPDPFVRLAVVQKAYLFHEEPETLRVLHRYTTDKNVDVRREAVFQLGIWFGADAATALRDACKDEDENVRAYATCFYYKLTGDLDFFLSLPTRERKRALGYASLSDIPYIEDLFAKEPNALIRKDLLEKVFGYFLLNKDEVVSILRIAAQDVDAKVRRTVVRLISRVHPAHLAMQELIKILDVLRDDEIKSIRLDAEKVYQRILKARETR